VKRFIFTIFILGLILGGPALAQSKVEVNFFYSQTCPHCAKEKAFLEDLGKKYPSIEIKEYEVTLYPENQAILKDFFEKYGVPATEQGYVPITFTPTEYFVGFNDKIGQDIESCLEECLGGQGKSSETIRIPWLGEVNLAEMSLPVLTLVIGLLDGFNPCAMWILVVLVSLLLSLKSRKKIALVGGTFILAEGLLYFLFMTAWLNIFLAIKYGFLTRILIGIFGIIFGIWRFRDFLSWKPGVCKVVDHSQSQEKIIGRMKNVLNARAVPAAIAGVILLAFGVNLIEFLCSAGFPVMYTRILALANIGTIQYYLYLFFYNVLYMLDDLIVFGLAFFAFSRFSFSDKYNRYSTLLAAVLIFILGILMILRPQLLMFG
jgi:thiol-disulfide isomerase/thioredoxin